MKFFRKSLTIINIDDTIDIEREVFKMAIGYVVTYGVANKIYTYNRTLAYKVAKKKCGEVRITTSNKIRKALDRIQ